MCCCRLLSRSFRGWSQAADKLCQQTLADGYEELAGQVGAMKAENERLRRDNERFVRLIDSGEWGRGRVAELTQAGEPSHALPWGDMPELLPAVDSPVAVDLLWQSLNIGFMVLHVRKNVLLINMGTNAGFCLDVCVHMPLYACLYVRLIDCLSVCLSGWLAD